MFVHVTKCTLVPYRKCWLFISLQIFPVCQRELVFVVVIAATLPCLFYSTALSVHFAILYLLPVAELFLHAPASRNSLFVSISCFLNSDLSSSTRIPRSPCLVEKQSNQPQSFFSLSLVSRKLSKEIFIVSSLFQPCLLPQISLLFPPLVGQFHLHQVKYHFQFFLG